MIILIDVIIINQSCIIYKNKGESNMKKFLALVLVLFIAFSATACGKSGDSATTQEQPNVFVYAVCSEPVIYWDPSDTISEEIVVMNNLYEQLMRYNPEKDSFDYLLATDYTVSDDGLVWTFNLRHDVYFHCGEKFDANAVKYAVDRTVSRGQGASYIWEPLKEVRVVDEDTVEFELKYPAAFDMIVSAGYTAHIFCPKHAEEGGHDWFNQGNACGTGPYKLKSWERGNEVVMEKFDDYWRGWKDNQYDMAIIKLVSETSTRRQMIESNTAQIITNMPFEDVDALKDINGIEVINAPSFQNLAAYFNTDKEPLNNKLVRQALSYAVPYQQIVEHVMSGYASQSKGPIPQNLWGHDDSLFQYNLDLEKAKSLLEKAGYKPGDIKLLLTYKSGDENQRKTAELMKAEMQKIGVELEIRGMPWDAQWEMSKSPDPKNRQDIYMMYWWPDYADPYTWMNALYHTEDVIVFNLGYWENSDYDKLVEDANAIAGVDRNKAVEKYSEAQKILIDEAPAIFLYDQSFAWIKRAEIKGFYSNPVYTNVVFFYDLYTE
jgi:peptide/nickel transport system substrate-binding protein